MLSRWVARRLVSTSVRKRSGVAGISVLPRKLTMPLRRDGLDPLPALGHKREAEPVSKLSRVLGMNVWAVSGYEQARAVLNDSVHYSNDIRTVLGKDVNEPIGGLGFTDPPDHTRLRRFLSPAFSGRRLAAMLPRIEMIVDERLDAMAAAGPVADLVAQFAFPVPFLVICELLGLPEHDRERFHGLAPARFDVTGGGAGTFGAVSQSRAFMLAEIEAQRSDPGPGLLGAIIREHGDEITDMELAGLADGVFTGGYETSASMLALGTLALLRDGGALEAIRRDGDAVDAIVEELLRYLSVVQISFPRFARSDFDLYGQRIRSGDVVICSLSGANRDAIFGEMPDRFDPSRRGRAHLAFGQGIHRCIGAELARMELRVAFRGLARRFPALELAVDPSELRFRDLSIVYGVDALPVRLFPDPAFPDPSAAVVT